jgi:hypothetical protein
VADLEATFFVREASGPVDGAGPGAVLVCVNFEGDAIELDLPPEVEPRNLAEPSDDGTSTVTVDIVGVFPLERQLDRTPVARPVVGRGVSGPSDRTS